MNKGQMILRPEMEYCSSLEKFEENCSERLKLALEVADEVHFGEKRKTPPYEPYISHCIAVSSILKSWGADEDEKVAGLLHDSVENHPDLLDLPKIKELFGARVAFLVDGVTKLKTGVGDKSEFETLQKVARESLFDVGVVKIKLADRKHNMMTMEGMKPEVQYKKAKETLTVYAPLAEAFGMWQVKNELEDLSFKYFDPERFENIRSRVDKDPRLKLNFVKDLKKEIEINLKKYGLDIQIEHQVAGYWEVSEKQKKRGIRGGSLSKSIREIPDVLSIRVLVEESNLVDCYKAMGIVRMLFTKELLVGRHEDLLRESAVNGYSALKDVYVFGEGSVEICFTSVEREEFNNWGITIYSSKESNRELFSRKTIFTPKGELVFLEPIATGIDVAYKLNPILGLRAVTMKVDGKVCGLETVVPNASLVEVLTDTNKKTPEVSWLEFCNLETRRQIEKQLMVSERDSLVKEGKEILKNEVLIMRGVMEFEDLDESIINRLLVDMGCWYGVNDLYYKVAMGMDILQLSKRLDEMGVEVGVYTTVQITGENEIGVENDVSAVLAKHKADARNVTERVFQDDRFLIRILMKVDYKGKKKIEEELKKKYAECVVV